MSAPNTIIKKNIDINSNSELVKSALKQTTLHDIHALQAKMVDFGGWHMPIHYGSQIQEHQAVRQNVGVFDVSHMCVCDVYGQDAYDFLRYILANDIQKLKPQQALYSCMLNENGGVIDDLIIYNATTVFNSSLEKDTSLNNRFNHYYRIVLNAGCAEKDVAWLKKQAEAFSQFKINSANLHIQIQKELNILAIQGPKAIDVLSTILSQNAPDLQNLKPFFADAISTETVGQLFIGRTGYTGEDGFEIIIHQQYVEHFWQQLMQAGVQPCGLGARDTLRLEAGMHLYGQDMDEQTKPHNASLDWTLDYTDTARNYIGKAAIAAERATHHILGLYLKSGGILRAHQKINTPFGEGEITSGTFSPSIGVSIAMAKLPKQVQPGDEVTVQIRQQDLLVNVVKLPFVRKGQIKIKI